jgi:preprotein translocase subunit SecD
MIGETPFLEFREVKEEQSTSSVSFVPTALNGRYVTSAQVGRNATAGFPEIDFSLNEEGAVLFEEITGANIGKPICLFIDGQPIIPDNIVDSCPRVQDRIAGGKARITGQFTLARAKQIVERFNAGALPAPITLVNQQTIGADFGKDSLEKAVFAGAIGMAAVIVFMLLYYRTLGIFASLALLIYTALTLGVFKLIPITLTLSGIAGFILSIGMAVDANILVFERTKEEMKKGIPHAAAIEEGFRRAWTSIRDSNTSTMITAAVLYFLTSSFVQGFALTLFIGVVVSIFSAITTTRLMLRLFLK